MYRSGFYNPTKFGNWIWSLFFTTHKLSSPYNVRHIQSLNTLSTSLYGNSDIIKRLMLIILTGNKGILFGIISFLWFCKYQHKWASEKLVLLKNRAFAYSRDKDNTDIFEKIQCLQLNLKTSIEEPKQEYYSRLSNKLFVYFQNSFFLSTINEWKNWEFGAFQETTLKV